MRQIRNRIGALEATFAFKEPEHVVIYGWRCDSEAECDEKLARWRAGEDVEGAPTNVVDRENAHVAIIRLVELKRES